MIDDRLVLALAGILEAGGVHQRCCLIGGQALRDLYHALQEYIGPEIPGVRASQDLDLLLSMGQDVEADNALHAHLHEHWELIPGRGATYRWRKDGEVELDLATSFSDHEQPGKVARVTLQGSRRINAYRMIPTWLHTMNLIEPCHGIELRRIGLERLRHTALLIAKVLAVDACLRELEGHEPAAWAKRMDRDLEDML
jgi:hypothetical protein